MTDSLTIVTPATPREECPLIAAIALRAQSREALTIVDVRWELRRQLDAINELFDEPKARPAPWLLLRTRLIEIAAIALAGGVSLGLDSAGEAAAKDIPF